MPSVDLASIKNRNFLRGSRGKGPCELQPDDLDFIRATVLRQRQAQEEKHLKQNLSASTPALNLPFHHTWRLDDELSIRSVSSSSCIRDQNGSISPATIARTQQGPRYEWMEEQRRKPTPRILTPSSTRSPGGARIFSHRQSMENVSRMRHSPSTPPARRCESAQSLPTATPAEPLQRPKRKDLISAHSWRRGQEIIKREIGTKKPRPSKEANVTSERKEMAADFPSDPEPPAAEEEETNKDENQPKSAGRRRRRTASTPTSPTQTSSSPPRHRHYDPNVVRSYLRRQREARRRAREGQLAEEEARKARRQEQLADLHRRQRESATATPHSSSPPPPEKRKIVKMEESPDRSDSRTPTNMEPEDGDETEVLQREFNMEAEEAGLQERILALEGSANSLQLRVQRLAESLQEPRSPPVCIDPISPIPRSRGGSLEAVPISPFFFHSPLMLSRSMESGLHQPLLIDSTLVQVNFPQETAQDLQMSAMQCPEILENSNPSTKKARSKSFEGNVLPRRRRDRRAKPRTDRVSASLESADTEDDVASSLTSHVSEENGPEERSTSTGEKEDEAARAIQKDLMLRERQLAERRRVAEEMLRWRSRLDAEEAEVRALEQKALQLCKVNAKPKEEKAMDAKDQERRPCSGDETTVPPIEDAVDPPAVPPVPPPRHRRQIGRAEPKEDKGDKGEEEAEVPPQPTPALTNRLKQRLAGGGSGLTALTLTNKLQPPINSTPSPASSQSTPSSFSERQLRIVSKQEVNGSEEEDSQSVSISETDVSEIEGRVRALSEELKRRRRMADRLKREQKRKHRERLKQKEDVLQHHIEMYDKYISELQIDLNAATSALPSSSTAGAPSSCNSSDSIDSPPVRPKIKSPRAATQQQFAIPSIPATPSSSSAADEEDEGEEEKGDPRTDADRERKESEGDEKVREEVEENEGEEEEDTLTPQIDDDAAPTIRSELTDIPRDEDGHMGSPAHVRQRRDSLTTEAEVESSVWSAGSDSEPEREKEKDVTQEELKAAGIAEDIISRLLSETLDLVAGPALELRVDVAVDEWLSSTLSQTIDRALAIRQRHHRNTVKAPRSAENETAPWAVPGIVPILSPPAHFAGSSVAGGAVMVPFRLVDHWPSAVSALVQRYVERLWPLTLEGSLEVSFDIEEDEMPGTFSVGERRARAAYRKLVFDLTRDCIRQVMETEGRSTGGDLLPGPSRYRVWRGTKPPSTMEDLLRIVDEAVAVAFGFRPCVFRESRLSRWTASRKREHVEELLVHELRREEPSWTDYTWDERRVKLQAADSIVDSLVTETAQLCLRLHRPHSDTSKLV